jgi:hypothetical protein
MNKKSGFVWLSVIMIAVIMTAGGLFLYQNSLKEDQIDDKVSESTLRENSYNFTDPTVRATCEEWGGVVSTNQTDPNINKLKNYMLQNTNISSKYFDEHFRFGCLMYDDSNDNETSQLLFGIFYFSIGEYVRDIQISLYPSKISFKDLNEIKNTITKEEAIKKMESCIPNPNKSLSIRLYSGGLFVIGFGDKHWVGEVNLETGKCVKSQQILQI